MCLKPLSGWLTSIALMLSIVAASSRAIAQTPVDSLRESFENPPPAAWPRTWWHWTKGAVRKEGITKDLEWMQRVGIAGFQLADVNFGGGQTVEPTVDFGTPEWLEAVRHAAAEADRLGLEMAIFSSPGWSLTGGPWVEPAQAMKKLVWSEIQVTGPRDPPGRLPQPPSSEGAFQDFGAGRTSKSSYYRDACVLAYPTPTVERGDPLAPDEVSSSNGPIEGDLLFDSHYGESLSLRSTEDGGATWIEQRFDEPVTVRSVTIAGRAGIPVGRIAASDDGKNYRTLVTLPGSQLYRQARVRTFSVPETTARWFRLEMTGAPLRPAETMSEAAPQPAESYTLVEWRLDEGARVNRWEEKAGFGHLFEYDSVSTPPVGESATIAARDVIDLTDRLQPDGSLDWDVPDGEWTVLRLGYSLTGARNRPATPAGQGYEVDKLSRQHTSDYYDAYGGLLSRALGDLYGKSLRYWLIDSWEAGTQNWTDAMIAEFTRRRGYDPTPYLPALVGRVVDSAETSDRFLWDFRRTLADMFAENHYGVLRERLAQDGLQVYSEASGVSLEIPEDTLLNKSQVDIPMGEFWVRDLHPRIMYLQDVRGAASAAHAYGKPIVAAEAFTGGGYEAPFALKRVSDFWLAQGINRLVYHTSAHQPLDTLPGNTMVGTHLHRNITWAEQARPINEYFARICHLLQQGKAVVDIAYLLDEGAPSTPSIWGAGTQPAPPAGYEHDFINADVLLHRLAVADDGRLVLPDGMSYRLLVLPESRRMRPEVLEKLHELVMDGATILGPRPLASPSLMGQPAADARVTELAEATWGDLNGTTRTVRHVGKGIVVWGRTLGQTLDLIGLEKDFEWVGPLDAKVAWTHRHTDDADIYYISNLTDQPARLETRCRVAGRGAQLWRPDTGEVEQVASTTSGDRSKLQLDLKRNETLFVVFCGPTPTEPSVDGPQRVTQLTTLFAPWTVEFPPQLGAPVTIELRTLEPWTQHELADVRYFSGTATYTTEFDVPDEWFVPGRRLVIDLGEVRDLAEVKLNDKRLGLLWKPPYDVDVSGALHPGSNRLEVKVTNQWNNRIVGDLALPPGERVLTGADQLPRFPRPRLQDSGLLGPVRVVAVD